MLAAFPNSINLSDAFRIAFNLEAGTCATIVVAHIKISMIKKMLYRFGEAEC